MIALSVHDQWPRDAQIHRHDISALFELVITRGMVSQKLHLIIERAGFEKLAEGGGDLRIAPAIHTVLRSRVRACNVGVVAEHKGTTRHAGVGIRVREIGVEFGEITIRAVEHHQRTALLIFDLRVAEPRPEGFRVAANRFAQTVDVVIERRAFCQTFRDTLCRGVDETRRLARIVEDRSCCGVGRMDDKLLVSGTVDFDPFQDGVSSRLRHRLRPVNA